ncbi:hypothetical protein TWF103_008365 [Orbilia oligospora]|nr:hypothetical protein TWF103_008365 [Orbilia oligospora]
MKPLAVGPEMDLAVCMFLVPEYSLGEADRQGLSRYAGKECKATSNSEPMLHRYSRSGGCRVQHFERSPCPAKCRAANISGQRRVLFWEPAENSKMRGEYFKDGLGTQVFTYVTMRIIDLWALTPYFRLLLIHADYQSIHPGHDSMVRTQFLGHERYGYGLLADSERIDIFVVPTPTMTNSFVNIRRRTQPSSNFDMKRSRAGEVQSQKPSPSDSCSSSHQNHDSRGPGS